MKLKVAAHIATAAVQNELPGSSCRVCPRNASYCRGKSPLNGIDAAFEFTRHLRPWARTRVLGPKENT